MKIVIVGAGSRQFGPQTLANLVAETALHGRSVELALVDVDELRLGRMLSLGRRMSEYAGVDYAITASTDVRAALPGASYVIAAVERGMYPLWEQSFRVPMALGFRQISGENAGPGGFFHTLRSLQTIIPICRAMEELSPDAFLINHTNPLHRLSHAIPNLTSIRSVGYCHAVFEAIYLVRQYLGLEPDEIRLVTAGINHFSCVLSAVDRRTGVERLPEALAKVQADVVEPRQRLFQRFAQVFGVLVNQEDHETGEFVSFGCEFHDGRWYLGQEQRGSPYRAIWMPVELTEQERGLAAVIDDDAPIADHPFVMQPDREHLAAAIIADIELDRGTWREAVNVINSGGYIDNLPRTAAVEVPATIDAGGIQPDHVGSLPEPYAALVRRQLTVTELTTEAYRQNSRKLALQALLLDPVVDGIARAERLLDTMLELQAEYLPSLE